jgi:predicted nucleotidyltransferase/DNA-binding XRE family transcriptional regulator
MRTSEVTAAAVLRKARVGAGLTQRALAQRAGITQSVVAAYESGSREPSLATLSALVDATGYSLSVALTASQSAPAAVTGPIGHRLRRRRAAVLSIAEQHGVTDLQVFGSVARGEDTAESDLDLLVHLPDGAGLFAVARFKEDLEAPLRVSVDVVPDDGVKPRVRANIERDLVAL